MYQCYVKCVRKGGGGGGGKDSKSSVTQVTRSFYDRPTLFPNFFFLFSPQRGGGHEDKMMIDSKEKIWEREKKKGISFYGADAPCSVISVFFYSLCECVSVSESPCRTFWDIEAVGKSQLQTFGRKRGKKQQLCRTNSARSNLKTVFFPN